MHIFITADSEKCDYGFIWSEKIILNETMATDKPDFIITHSFAPSIEMEHYWKAIGSLKLSCDLVKT